MGYLHYSSGPILVPPLPADPRTEDPQFMGELGLRWEGLTSNGHAPLRYRIPRALFYYLTDLASFEKYGRFGERAQGDTSIPSDRDALDYHRRALYWTLVLFTVGHELLNQTVVPPGYPIHVSAGFLNPETEVDAFGLAISIDPALLPYDVLPAEPTRLYSLPIVQDRRIRLPEIYGWSPDGFGPYVARRPHRNFQWHRPPGFGSGTTASYVRDATTGTPMGLLGCRHAVPDPTIGAAVPMPNGAAQKVVAVSAERAIDLIVVSSPTPVPSTPRPVHRWPAQFQPCAIDGDAGGVTHTRIAQITNTWGVFSDPLRAVYVDLDDCGIPGDSGAAVLDTTSTSPGGVCGVYAGAYNSPGPLPGYAIHIQQVEKIMGVELVQ